MKKNLCPHSSLGLLWSPQPLSSLILGRVILGLGFVGLPKVKTPDPCARECVVYHNFLVAEIRLPVDPVVPEILARFRLVMHHLTPNAIVQLLKFLRAVKTLEGLVCVWMFFVDCMRCILRERR